MKIFAQHSNRACWSDYVCASEDFSGVPAKLGDSSLCRFICPGTPFSLSNSFRSPTPRLGLLDNVKDGNASRFEADSHRHPQGISRQRVMNPNILPLSLATEPRGSLRKIAPGAHPVLMSAYLADATYPENIQLGQQTGVPNIGFLDQPSGKLLMTNSPKVNLSVAKFLRTTH